MVMDDGQCERTKVWQVESQSFSYSYWCQGCIYDWTWSTCPFHSILVLKIVICESKRRIWFDIWLKKTCTRSSETVYQKTNAYVQQSEHLFPKFPTFIILLFEFFVLDSRTLLIPIANSKAILRYVVDFSNQERLVFYRWWRVIFGG